MLYRPSFIVFIVFIVSCQKPLPHLDGIDSNWWKKDRNACMGIRSSMIGAVRDQKEKLKTLAEIQIVDLLGRPDENELFMRNQKIYIYYLEAGIPCGHAQEEYKKLVIRFNAVGIAKEVFVK